LICFCTTKQAQTRAQLKKPMDKRPHAPDCFCYKCEAEQFSAARAAKEEAEARRSAATCSQSVIGYRLKDGTDKMECYFLPGRPQQRTLDMVAEHLKAGWILTEVIRPANKEL
jgi:hypothetical protein